MPLFRTPFVLVCFILFFNHVLFIYILAIFIGRYLEYHPESEDAFIAGIKNRFSISVELLKPAPLGNVANWDLVFLPVPGVGGSSYEAVVRGLNQYVYECLNGCAWGFPSFRPSIKYHKDPLKLRPIVCKRGTPSIGVGNAIRYVVSKVR